MMRVAVERFLRVLSIVQESERTNTRSAGVDYEARCLLRDHGEELRDLLVPPGADLVLSGPSELLDGLIMTAESITLSLGDVQARVFVHSAQSTGDRTTLYMEVTRHE